MKLRFLLIAVLHLFLLSMCSRTIAKAFQAPERADLGDIILVSSGEGQLKTVDIDGRKGWTVTAGRCLYGEIKKNRKRSPHLRLQILVNPGGYRGAISVPYDSSDDRAFGDPNHTGVWKPSKFTLEGQTSWITVTLEWPDGRFAGNCNGYDFRIELPGELSVVLGSAKIEELTPLAMPLRPVRLPMAALLNENVTSSGGMLRLAGYSKQVPGQPIVINAIDAKTVTLFGGNEVGIEGAPAGGAFIHFVDRAEWAFEVTTAGSYQLWERAWFPVRGYNHDENVDGKQNFNIIDTVSDTPLNQWVWVKAGKYELAGGKHTFSMAYNGGARLDRLIFLPVGLNSPSEEGHQVSPFISAGKTVVITSDAQPIDVKHWINMNGSVVLRGGTVTTELSFDAGKSWHPILLDQPLSAELQSAGGKTARARITLSTGSDGVSPLSGGLAITYMPGPKDRILLANDKMEIAFGPAGVSGLRAIKQGTTILESAQNALFRLQVKAPGKAAPHWIASTEAAVLGRVMDVASKTLTQRYHFSNGISVTCRTRLQGADSRWELNIDNQSTLEVVLAEYPMLQNVRVGADYRDDTLMMPACWRQLIRNPVEAQFSQGQGIRDLAMHWAYLYDDKAGLYIGDHNWPVNDLSIWATRHSVNSLQFGLAREFGVLPGKSRNSDNYVVAVRPGGNWHNGADVYRKWANTVIKTRPMPAWTQRMDAWFNFDSNVLPSHGFSYLAPVLDRALDRGMGYYMGSNRGQIDGPIEYVGMWPVYCPAWGNLQELKDMHRELRDSGGHANWYMNWQLTSPKRVVDTPRIAGIIPKSWVEHPAMWPDYAWYKNTSFRGYTYPETPDLGSTRDELLQCVTSPDWQAHQLDGARLWSMYGADGMYYDQISVNNPVCSIDPNYNSTGDYGTWTRTSSQTLAKITRELSTMNPHFITSGELANDVIGQNLTFHMTSGVYNHIELLRYCMPDQGILDGGWNSGINDSTGGAERWRYIWMTGARFEGLTDTPYNTQLLALRRKVRAILYTAQPMDTVGIILSMNKKILPNPPPSAGLSAMGLVANGMNTGGTVKSFAQTGVELAVVKGPQATWFLLAQPNRGAIVNIIQDKSADGAALPLTVSVPTASFGQVKAAWALNLDGLLAQIKGQNAAGRYTFSLPGKYKAVSVLLVNSLGPIIEDVDLPFAAAPGSRMSGKALVTNYSSQTITGSLNWSLPSGWTASITNLSLAPGMSRSIPVVLHISSSAVMNKRYDMTLSAKAGDGGIATLPHWITVGSPLWVRLFRESDSHVTATVFNRSDKAQAGNLVLSQQGGVQVGVSSIPFLVAPWSQAKISLPISGMEKLNAPAHLIADAKVNGKVLTQRSLMLYPPVSNGGFEDDAVGDSHPDWWLTATEQDTTEYNLLGTIDYTNPFKGKGCLRLAPNPSGKFLRSSPFVTFLDKGRYHIQCAIRKTAPGDDVVVQFADQRLTTEKAGEWVVVEKEFEFNGNFWGFGIQLINRSRNSVWFDELRIEKIN